jgi:creatinine amidohydrolase/Fe(II)-dependent formamide hydrolase-like protein
MRLQHLLPHQFKKAVDEGWPLLVPAGCIEYHGPHMALGLDTIIVEELLEKVSARVNSVVAPPFWYGPTGSAVTGAERGTLDVSTERFGRHTKDVLNSFWSMGFKWIIICVHHQGLDGPESLALRQAAVEVTFERSHQERGDAWWGKAPLGPQDRVFERIQVWPSVLPAAAASGVVMSDHAGYYETSLLMAARPELVQVELLGNDAPWYCKEASKASIVSGESMWQSMVKAWVDDLSRLVRPIRPSPQDMTIQGLF